MNKQTSIVSHITCHIPDDTVTVSVSALTVIHYKTNPWLEGSKKPNGLEEYRSILSISLLPPLAALPTKLHHLHSSY